MCDANEKDASSFISFSCSVAAFQFIWAEAEPVFLETWLRTANKGAAAGYGSYIVGQAAKYYFEHGSSWGGEGPKKVVKRILDQTDKQSVLDQLKSEIRRTLNLNPHAGGQKQP